MGCFFACFRVRDDRPPPQSRLLSRSPSSDRKDVVASRIRLSSLFFSETTAENNEDSASKTADDLCFLSPLNTKQLRDEAKFLKACGTILETPAEIRKASQNLQFSPTLDTEPLKSNPGLSDTSVVTILSDDDPDECPKNAVVGEEISKVPGSSQHTPSSCLSDDQSNQRASIHSPGGGLTENFGTAVDVPDARPDSVTTSVPPLFPAADSNCRSKSVRFRCNLGASSDSPASGNRSIPKPTPHPTPLKLSDEMQTPGTVFTANSDYFAKRKSRIRSQYVYPVRNPVEGVSQWKSEEEDSGSDRLTAETEESVGQRKVADPASGMGGEKTTDFVGEASLLTWTKPENTGTARSRRDHFGRTSRDRPIIGIVAAHWGEEEVSHISTGRDDKNGIPNSTTKYKEDQKVRWHATPFEERLEKALSEESFISQRENFNRKAIIFNEQESDTAISGLKSSTVSNSVVSC